MTSIVLLATTYLLTLPALLLVIFIGVLVEASDNSTSVFFGIIAATISYFMFDIPFWFIVGGGVAYLVAGIVWSFWRYKRHVEHAVAVCNYPQSSLKPYEKKRIMEEVEPKKMVSRIVSWIIVWPFSVIENITGDLIRVIKNLVTETLQSIYAKIHTSARSKLNVVELPESSPK